MLADRRFQLVPCLPIQLMLDRWARLHTVSLLSNQLRNPSWSGVSERITERVAMRIGMSGRCGSISNTGFRGMIIKLALCLAVGGLAVGCASATAAGPGLTASELAVLGNAGLSGSAAAAVNNAVETLVQECMQSKGLVYYPNFLTAADAASQGPGLAGLPQAHIGLAAREANGYSFYSRALRSAAAPSPSQSQGTPRQEQYAASLTKDARKPYLLALDGPDSSRISVTLPGGATSTAPSGGCEGIAERRVYGSVSNYVLGITGASLLNGLLLNAVTADPAFGTVISSWSACMTKRGYHYDSPEGLWNKLATRIDESPTPAMQEVEIKTAVADYNCSSAVRLVPTVSALQTKHAAELSSALLESLASITQIETTALANAKSLHLSN